MWYHYKDSKLISIMNWDSLPEICHKWWEDTINDYNGKFKIEQKDLIFLADEYGNSITSLDDMCENGCICVMPHCHGHCGSKEGNADYLNYLEKAMEHLKAFIKENNLSNNDEEWTDEQRELYKQAKPPHWIETEEYLISLRKHLDFMRNVIIDEIKVNKGPKECIIYKESEAVR